MRNFGWRTIMEEITRELDTDGGIIKQTDLKDIGCEG